MLNFIPPERARFEEIQSRACIFLAGSIEMGRAIPWQSKVISALAQYDGVIFNPRRTDWDASWKQSIDNPHFNEQVNWELDHLAQSDLVFFFFQGDTLSPISLMELGIACASGTQVVVVAENGFWRRGNIEVMCDRHEIPLFSTLNEGIQYLHEYFGGQPEV